MKHILLTNVEPENDVDFLNQTNIQFSFRNMTPLSTDSGWCDYTTGSRLLSTNDAIIFVAETSEDEVVLKLKFGDRLI